MKHTQTFSILIWLNKARGSAGQCALFARVTVNGKRSEISLKRGVHESKWDGSACRVKGSSPEALSLNIYINEVKTSLYGIYQEMASNNEFISAEAIKIKFNGETTTQRTLIQTVYGHNEDMRRKIGVDVAKGTWTKFNTLEKKLRDYLLKHMKKTDVFLEQLDYTFVTDFEYYLRHYEKTSSNTAMKYIRMLKKIMNDTVRRNWLDKNPFQQFKCAFRWPEKVVITGDELKMIIEKDFSIERLQLVKDYFVFSCFTGLAYIDIVSLKPTDISIGIDGNLWLVLNRHKTGTLVRVPILEQALKILEKYKGHPVAIQRGCVFPAISNQKLNSYLKEIGDICGIAKNLTFHLARHTFATTVTLSNGVPIESVSKMLGHSKITTTQIYAKVVEKKLSEDMDRLKQKLNEDLLVVSARKELLQSSS
jgi:integrase/recombinase XerD